MEQHCGSMRILKCHFTDGTKGFHIDEEIGSYYGEATVESYLMTRSTFPTDFTMEKVVDKTEGEPQRPEALP
jgi:hypothetical protein